MRGAREPGYAGAGSVPGRIADGGPAAYGGAVMSTNLPSPLATRLAGVVRAIAEAEVAEELGRDELAGIPFLDDTAEVLQARLLGMPSHFAAGMVALTLAFDKSTRATHGASFSRLSVADRRRVLARLRKLPLGPLKNFTTFYDKMAPFIFWSELEEHHQLHVVLGEGVA